MIVGYGDSRLYKFIVNVEFNPAYKITIYFSNEKNHIIIGNNIKIFSHDVIKKKQLDDVIIATCKMPMHVEISC